MLYDRWKQTAAAHSAATAVVEMASGTRWSFADLDRAAESLPVAQDPVAIARGQGVGFLCEVLRAWRDGRPCCPLEEGQAIGFDPRLLPRCAHVKTTSGSGGTPRHILFTEAQLAADADQIVSTMGLAPHLPNLGVISLAHSYGFSNLVLPLLLHGIPLILASAPLPETLRAAAQEAERVTLAAVPALWRAWHEAGCIPANVALALSAGAPLPLALEEAVLRRHGLKIHNFYGSSECGGIAYDRTSTVRPSGTFAGRAMQGVSLELSGHGTLVVRGPAVGLTVWPEPDPRLGEGCFETSDLAELRDGQVFLSGRAGDLANIAGRKVAPESVEEALRAHPKVLECVVFSLPELGHRGEQLAAAVKTASPVESVELARFLSARLPAWQIPKVWWFPPELEANARGKLSRSAWRERYLRHAAG